jgi:hypothetical protein
MAIPHEKSGRQPALEGDGSEQVIVHRLWERSLRQDLLLLRAFGRALILALGLGSATAGLRADAGRSAQKC